MRPAGAERVVLARARGQHGVIAWCQIQRAGLSPGWVSHRVANGWLQRLHRGVYLVGPLEVQHSHAMAATLAVGADALLSHYPAAVLGGFRPPRPGPMEVTIPGRERRDREGIRVHSAQLHPHDATRRHGIPVTSPARTLLDLAATATANELARAVEEAQVQRRVSVDSLNEQFSRYPRHRGTAALKEAIRTDPKLTRSEAERTLLELIRRAGLPEPETNARIAGYEVDFVWRERKLVVEVDGYAFHSMRSSFERDRRRDAELTRKGWRVIRITWRQLTEEPVAVAATLATALAA
jgi:very-short-patch-repair endonuclease